MQVGDLALSGAKLIAPPLFRDERGLFLELYNQKYYRSLGVTSTFVQDNVSFSHQGVLRGMHFHSQGVQSKLVSVGQGEIFDVIVDLRPESSTYKQWLGVTLNSEKREQLFIPEGFAHGFYVMSETALVIYKVSTYFDPVLEKGFRYDDPTIGIEWPFSKPPSLSEKDHQAPFF